MNNECTLDPNKNNALKYKDKKCSCVNPILPFYNGNN